jgi:hypothetical protein
MYCIARHTFFQKEIKGFWYARENILQWTVLKETYRVTRHGNLCQVEHMFRLTVLCSVVGRTIRCSTKKICCIMSKFFRINGPRKRCCGGDQTFNKTGSLKEAMLWIRENFKTREAQGDLYINV